MDCSDMCKRDCVLFNDVISLVSSFARALDGPSPSVATYNSAYGLSSAHYSAPNVAIAPAVSKVIATPAVSTYYSANKLAYSSPSFVKQVSYGTAAPPLQYISPAISTGHAAGYGIAKAAYSVTPAAKYVSTAYANPAAITSSYVAGNKYAYTGPNVAAQYAASYTPSIAASYVSAPIAKQVSYATNPLLAGGAAYVSGYKTGAAYVATPASVATTLGGAGLIKTAGYHASSHLGYDALFSFLFLNFGLHLASYAIANPLSDIRQPKRLSHRRAIYHPPRIWLRQISCLEELN